MPHARPQRGGASRGRGSWEGAGRGAPAGFSFIWAARVATLLPDLSWKKPLSVEVNGPAQIKGVPECKQGP